MVLSCRLQFLASTAQNQRRRTNQPGGLQEEGGGAAAPWAVAGHSIFSPPASASLLFSLQTQRSESDRQGQAAGEGEARPPLFFHLPSSPRATRTFPGPSSLSHFSFAFRAPWKVKILRPQASFSLVISLFPLFICLIFKTAACYCSCSLPAFWSSSRVNAQPFYLRVGFLFVRIRGPGIQVGFGFYAPFD